MLLTNFASFLDHKISFEVAKAAKTIYCLCNLYHCDGLRLFAV